MSDETSLDAEAVQPDEGQGQPIANESEVQPGEGQGHEDGYEGLYDLNAIDDPAVRSEVERIAKDIDRNVNSKLQDAAEYRKGWEPYEHLGLNQLDPEGLGALLSFADALSDESTAQGALMDLAQQVGVDISAQNAEGFDPEASPLSGLESEVADLREWKNSQEERELFATVEAEETKRLQAEWSEVEERHGKPFSEDEQGRLRDLALKFVADSDTPISDAYDFIEGIAGRAQSALVDGAPDQPSPAEPAGQASTSAAPVESFEEAERLYRERRMATANSQ